MKKKNPKKIITLIIPFTKIARNFDIISTLQSITNAFTSYFPKSAKFELIFLTNSEGEFIEKMKKRFKNIRILVFPKNHRIDAMIFAALESSIGESVFIINPLNYDKKLIKKLITYSSKYDAIIGNNKLTNVNIDFKKKWIMYLINKFSSTKLFSNLTYTYYFSRRYITSLIRLKGKRRFLSYLIQNVGFYTKKINIPLSNNFIKEFNKTSFTNFLTNTFDALLSNSIKPIKFAWGLSIFSAILSLFFIIYVFLVILIKKNVIEGWFSTNILISSMFFLLFIVLAIILEYLYRILEEVREEPMYFISKDIDNSVIYSEKELNIQ